MATQWYVLCPVNGKVYQYGPFLNKGQAEVWNQSSCPWMVSEVKQVEHFEMDLKTSLMKQDG